MRTNYLKKYIINSYILVWLLIIFVAGTASLVFHAPPVVMWIVRNLIAWSPIYLLLLGWKHFRPDETRTAFVKRCFSGKIKPLLLVLSFMLVFGISLLALFLFSCMEGRTMMSYINFGTTPFALSFFLSFTSGPTGGQSPMSFPNIVVITSITVLMNIFLERHNNLVYSVLLHFGFNILYVFLDADIGFFVILTVLYLSITPVAVLIRNKSAER